MTILNARKARGFAAALACAAPACAHASDFSFLMYVLYAITAVAAVATGFFVYLVAGGLQSMLGRALLWGCWLAVVFTPLSTQGGNGTLVGTPILAFASLIFGADPAYARTALLALLVSIPVCTAGAWYVQRQWQATAGPDDS